MDALVWFSKGQITLAWSQLKNRRWEFWNGSWHSSKPHLNESAVHRMGGRGSLDHVAFEIEATASLAFRCGSKSENRNLLNFFRLSEEEDELSITH